MKEPPPTQSSLLAATLAITNVRIVDGNGGVPIEHGTILISGQRFEAVGDAAELVSPDNVFDIARGIRDVLLDQNRRNALSTAGLEQAGRFHWDHTAQQVLDIYREIKG